MTDANFISNIPFESKIPEDGEIFKIRNNQWANTSNEIGSMILGYPLVGDLVNNAAFQFSNGQWVLKIL